MKRKVTSKKFKQKKISTSGSAGFQSAVSSSDDGSDIEEGELDYDLDFEEDEGHPFAFDDQELETIFESKDKTYSWSNIPPAQAQFQPAFDPSDKGFKNDLSKIRTPKDAFLQYMDEDLLDKICEFTNAEAAAASDSTFQPVVRQSLLAWIAVLVNAGRAKARNLNCDELWSTDPVNGVLFYRAVMSKNRYKAILR